MMSVSVTLMSGIILMIVIVRTEMMLLSRVIMISMVIMGHMVLMILFLIAGVHPLEQWLVLQLEAF